MIKWFRKKPVKVQAVRFDHPEDILSFYPEAVESRDGDNIQFFIIETPEGKRRLYKGEWLIKGPKGNFYKCEPDIMEEFYEEIDEDQNITLEAQNGIENK